MGKIILDVNDVCKSFSYGSNNLEVLKNFTLRLNKKEIITISGQSGCGKSTALNIMSSMFSCIFFCGWEFSKKQSVWHVAAYSVCAAHSEFF